MYINFAVDVMVAFGYGSTHFISFLLYQDDQVRIQLLHDIYILSYIILSYLI